MKEQRKGHFLKKLALTVLWCVLILTLVAGTAIAQQWNAGVSADSRGITGFHLSIGEYYDVPQEEVVIMHRRGIADEELPVVFYLARLAHVSPQVIVRMRLDGRSWMDITYYLGLSPVIYYVPVPYYEHHPYPHGHAYGHYKKYRHKSDWRGIRLSDAEVVNQVNLKFISEHYRYEPREVMMFREQGRRFPVINDEAGRKHRNDGDRRYIHTGQAFVPRGDSRKPEVRKLNPEVYERKRTTEPMRHEHPALKPQTKPVVPRIEQKEKGDWKHQYLERAGVRAQQSKPAGQPVLIKPQENTRTAPPVRIKQEQPATQDNSARRRPEGGTQQPGRPDTHKEQQDQRHMSGR